MHQSRAFVEQTPCGQVPSPRGTVVIICPGGLEDGGGIGRQMGYFLKAYDSRISNLSYRVFDSRGPWFLGASRLRIGLAGFYLASCMQKLVAARISAAPCIVHVNIAGRGSTVRKVILITLARVVGLPYLLHVHDSDYAEDYRRRGRLMRTVIANVFRAAKRVLVLGERDRDALLNLLHLQPDQISVLHNAVPDPHSLRAGRRADEPCHLLFLGYLSARKGVPELLQALGSPAVRFRRWRATLAGGGPVEEFRRLAADLGLADRVEFLGWIDQPAVRAICADADILVLPSYAEGLAMSVLEGLSHGLAVVATPVGAHKEVIEPEVSGILVPPGDVDALAAALLRIIEDPALRDRLQAGARRRFLEKFDVQSYAERLSGLHATLISDVGNSRNTR